MSAAPFDVHTLGELYPFRPTRVEVAGGHTVSVVDEGPRDAPVLLMVHGNPTWSFYYRELILGLRDRFRCVAVDHLGAGLSDKPQAYAYTLANHVANLEAVVERLGIERLTLVVHDWGGAIGMGWGTRHPERVDRCVVFNTAAFRSERIPPSINLCRVPLVGDLLIRGFNGFARAALIRAAKKPLPAPVQRGYLLPYRSWRDRVGHLRFVQDIPMHAGIPSWDAIQEIEEGLAQLRDKPFLICWGGEDFCFNDSFLDEWRARFPEAEVHRFPHAGHYVLEDAGPEILELLQGFLARTALTPAEPGR
ncbi:MAG: alpha/beta fold hydrolase [Planctomycetota bacterium]